MSEATLDLFKGEPVIERVIHEITQWDNNFEPESGEWLHKILDLLSLVQGVRRGLSTAEAYIFSILEKRWIELPVDFRNQYNDDFETWVFQVHRRRPATLRADLRAIRIFMTDKLQTGKSVKVPMRDTLGQIIRDADGETRYQHIRWNPVHVSLSKLKIAAGAAERGSLSAEDWSLLADEAVGPQELLHHLTEETDLGSGQSSTNNGFHNSAHSFMQFSLEGQLLCVKEGNVVQVLGELYFSDYYNDPYGLSRRALDHLLRSLGIEYQVNPIIVDSHDS